MILNGKIKGESSGRSLLSTGIVVVTNNIHIGDSLRSSAIAYWAMDETDGTRLDATGNGYNLSEVFTTTTIPHVPGVSGISGNAAKIQDSTIDAPFLEKTNINVDVSDGWTLAGWVYFPQFDQDAGTWFEINIVPLITLHVGIANTGEPDIIIYGTSTDNQVIVSPNTWHFFAMWQDGITFYLRVDDSVISSVYADIMSTTLTRMDIGALSYMGDNDYILYDELGLYNQVLSSNELDYLYNAGAGRTLFP